MEFLRRWITNPDVIRLITAVIGIVAIFVVVRILRRTLNRYVDDPALRYQARKFVVFAGYIAGLIMLSVIFRNRLANLALIFGIAGAGVAIALQEVIISVAGWLSISFGGLYRAGDRIQLAGIRGDVIDVSILRTTLMEIGEWVSADLYSGRIVRVANSNVYRQPVYNFSADFPFVWDEIVVPVRFGGGHREAREILTRVVNEVVGEYTEAARSDWDTMLRRYRLERARIEPAVTLVATDNWMEFTVRYVVDYKKRRSVQDQIFTRILDEIEKTDGRVALASATFEVVRVPELEVKLKNDTPDLNQPGTS